MPAPSRRTAAPLPRSTALTAAFSSKVITPICGVVFGFVMALVKGESDGFRYYIGKVGSLWLIGPALIGLVYYNALKAAACTLVVTCASLLLFYFTTDGYTLSTWSHVWHNRVFFLVVGSLGAALFSAATSIVASRLPKYGLIPLGLTFLAEPLIELVLSPQGSMMSNSEREVYLAEIVCGIVIIFGTTRYLAERASSWLDRTRG